MSYLSITFFFSNGPINIRFTHTAASTLGIRQRQKHKHHHLPRQFLEDNSPQVFSLRITYHSMYLLSS